MAYSFEIKPKLEGILKMKGERRVHFDPFVLTFSVDEQNEIVSFLDFDHHDKIYDK